MLSTVLLELSWMYLEALPSSGVRPFCHGGHPYNARTLGLLVSFDY